MNRRIVEEGSAPDGDGHVSYAAHLTVRRRNLACRPSGLGRLHHGAHESLPRKRRLISLPTIPWRPAETILDATLLIANRSWMSRGMPGQCHMPTLTLDSQRES